jgi:CheY-like chemotaxis protein
MSCSNGHRCGLYILHVEDSLADAELLGHHLNQMFECSVLRVDSQKDFQSAVHDNHFDVILSDITVPRFDLLKALEFAKTSCPDIPFIVLSGNRSPDLRQRALDEGAREFVSKDNYREVSNAIQLYCPRSLKDRISKLPRAGESVIAFCKTFRCLAFRDPAGIWRHYSTREELPEVIEWQPL